MQDGHVVAYESQHLTNHEKNFPANGLELATVVFVMKIWRHYLYDEMFEIYTN